MRGAVREVDESDHDRIVDTMTPDGSLPECVQVTAASVRARLFWAPSERPLSGAFNCHFAQAAYAGLARIGWEPEP